MGVPSDTTLCEYSCGTLLVVGMSNGGPKAAVSGEMMRLFPGIVRAFRSLVGVLGVTVLALVGFPGPSWGSGPAIPGGLVAAIPLVQDRPPVERRLQLSVKNAYREVRRSLKRSRYFIFNSPTWWGRRIKRLAWPMLFAIGALLLDSALISAWKNDGLGVVTTYVPLMLYVYGRLFFSRGVRLIPRLAVVVALIYGIWRQDLIRDPRWSSLGRGRIDDLVVILAAVRLFVYACPDALVEKYAQRAIALHGRILRARLSTRSH